MYEWYAREPVVCMCTSGMLVNRLNVRIMRTGGMNVYMYERYVRVCACKCTYTCSLYVRVHV